MLDLPITPLSTILEEGSDPKENKWLAATIDSFKHFECGSHGSFSEKFLVDYIRKDAIKTEEDNRGRTYLYIIPKGDPTNCDRSKLRHAKELELVGFFELSLTTVRLSKIEQDKQQDMESQGHVRNGSLPLYCIAELARSDKYKKELKGEEILQGAMGEIAKAVAQVGCGLVLLEAEPVVFDKFYKKHKFSEIQKGKVSGHDTIVAATNITAFTTPD